MCVNYEKHFLVEQNIANCATLQVASATCLGSNQIPECVKSYLLMAS